MSAMIIIGCIIFAFLALVYESPFIAAIGIAGVAYGVGFAAIGAVVAASPWFFVGALVGYLTLGALNALFLMWPAYIKRTVRRFKQSYAHKNGQKYSVPMASKNKTRIGSWIAYWPLHTLVWALDDPIRRVINRTIYSLRHVFSGVAVRTAKKALQNEGIEDWTEEEVQL